MAISKQQQRELANLARAANRRLERASEGQRAALDYYLRKYHTREGAHGTVFQQGQAKTEREYRARMAELRAFMGTEDRPTISTRRQWEAVKQTTLETGAEKLRGMGYNLSDTEFAQVMIETGGAKKAGKAFYTALNNVIAATKKARKSWNQSQQGKDEPEPFTGLTQAEITEAINARASDYQATLAAIKP